MFIWHWKSLVGSCVNQQEIRGKQKWDEYLEVGIKGSTISKTPLAVYTAIPIIEIWCYWVINIVSKQNSN